MRIFRDVFGTTGICSSDENLNKQNMENQTIHPKNSVSESPQCIESGSLDDSMLSTSGSDINGPPHASHANENATLHINNSSAIKCAVDAPVDVENPSSPQSEVNSKIGGGKSPKIVIAKAPKTSQSTPGKENVPKKKTQKKGAPLVHLKLLKMSSFTGSTVASTGNIARNPMSVVAIDNNEQHGEQRKVERPVRSVQQVVRLNYDIIKCCVCKKKIHVDNSTVHCDDGSILCSVKCFKNA